MKEKERLKNSRRLEAIKGACQPNRMWDPRTEQVKKPDKIFSLANSIMPILISWF